MKNLIMLTVLLNLVSCGSESTTLIIDNDKLDGLEKRIGVLENDYKNIQKSINQIYDELNEATIEVVKPCENSREVFFRVESGEIVAYFEQGKRRYLSYLEVGSYGTTDGTGCKFDIVENDGGLEIVEK